MIFLSLGRLKLSVQAEGKGKIVSQQEKVYEDMSLESDILENIIPGMNFEILSLEKDEDGNNWCLVYTQSCTLGYIPAENVTFVPYVDSTQEEQYVTSLERVNIRESASTDAEILGSLPKNEEVRVLAICGNEIGEVWYQIIYKDLIGFVRNTSLKIEEDENNVEVFELEKIDADNIIQKSDGTLNKETHTLQLSGRNDKRIDFKELQRMQTGSNENVLRISGFRLAIILSIIICGCLILFLITKVIMIVRTTGKNRKGK